MRHPLSLRPLLISGLLTLLSLACASTGTEISDASPVPASQPEPRPADTASGPEHAAVSEGQSDRAMPVVARETTPDRTRRESVPAHVRDVREQMEEAYQAGLEAYQAGRFDEAKEHFDRAVDCVLSSDVDLNQQPAFKKAFDEIVRNIADMDADLYAKDSEPEAQEDRSPLDNLKDISTYLP